MNQRSPHEDILNPPFVDGRRSFSSPPPLSSTYPCNMTSIAPNTTLTFIFDIGKGRGPPKGKQFTTSETLIDENALDHLVLLGFILYEFISTSVALSTFAFLHFTFCNYVCPEPTPPQHKVFSCDYVTSPNGILYFSLHNKFVKERSHAWYSLRRAKVVLCCCSFHLSQSYRLAHAVSVSQFTNYLF